MILRVYVYIFWIFYAFIEVRGNKGAKTIFELSKYHIHYLEMLKVRIVVTPYLSGHNTIIEWLQYHIRVISVLNLDSINCHILWCNS